MACPPLRGAEGRGHPQGPASASTTHFLSGWFLFFFLLPALQKWQLSFSVSLYLSVRNLSPVHVPAATFVLYSFFAGEEVCPSAPQQRPGPRASRLQTPSKFRHLDLGQLACFITMEQ